MVAKLPPLLPTIRTSSSLAAATVMDVYHRNGDGIDRWQLRNLRRIQRNNIAIRDNLDSNAPASSTVAVSDEQREPYGDENIDMTNITTTKTTIKAFAKEETRDDSIEIGSVDAVMANHDNKSRKRHLKLATVYDTIIKHHHYHSFKTSTEQRDPYNEERVDEDMPSRSQSVTKLEARDDAVHDHVTNGFSIHSNNLFNDESFAPARDVAILSLNALMQHQRPHPCTDVMDFDYNDDQDSMNDDSIITTTTVATTITSSSSISSSSNPSRFVGFVMSSSIDSSNAISFNETIHDRRHMTTFESFMVMIQEDDRSTTTTKTNDVPIHIGNHQSNDDLPFEILCSNDSWDNHHDSREESHLSLDDDDDDEDEGI